MGVLFSRLLLPVLTLPLAALAAAQTVTLAEQRHQYLFPDETGVRLERVRTQNTSRVSLNRLTGNQNLGETGVAQLQGSTVIGFGERGPFDLGPDDPTREEMRVFDAMAITEIPAGHYQVQSITTAVFDLVVPVESILSLDGRYAFAGHDLGYQELLHQFTLVQNGVNLERVSRTFGSPGGVSVDGMTGQLLSLERRIAPGTYQIQLVTNTRIGTIGGEPQADRSGEVTHRIGVSVQAVPEPASMAVLGLGLAGLARRKRRARRS